MNTPFPDPFERALAAYSAREQARLIAPPVGLADRTTAAILNRPRLPWKAVAASVLAGVLAITYIAWPEPPSPTPAPRPVVTVVEPGEWPSAPSSPNIGDTLSEAGTALAKLSRSTAEKAAPRTFLPGVFAGETDPPPPAGPQPNTDAIAAMPTAAKSGLEPMAGSTRRAISLFLRDTGLNAN